MKNVLLYYSFSFSFGGGEYLPLSFIAALQNVCRLTVAADMPSNIERAAEVFGIGIDLSKVKVVQVTPPGYDPKRHNALVSLYRFRHLKKLARHADICLSAANIMDFGRPAHHFINMLAFGDDAFTRYVRNHATPVRTGMAARAKRFLAEFVLRPLLGMRSKRSIIRDRREHVYPNSRFVEKLMADFFGPFNSTVFYPPTLFEAGSAAARDPLKVVYIGRIVPEKRITDLIGIVEKARAATGLDVKFHLAGRLNQTPAYGAELEKMAAERDWLKFTGPLYGEEKKSFLLSGSYAVHALRKEAFGISITEYLKAGVIPVVPGEGGACEVVDDPRLTFRSNEEAAEILVKLLDDVGFRESCRRRCDERAGEFSDEAYMKRQHELLKEIVGS